MPSIAPEIQTRQFRIWSGERKLLPSHTSGECYCIRCLSGSGYLRIMSRAERIPVTPGETVKVPGGEIATLSGVNTLLIEIATQTL